MLRSKAARASLDLRATIEQIQSGHSSPKKPLIPAREAEVHLEELRRLFFSVIEHMKELLKNQADTHDRSAAAQQATDEAKVDLLAPLVDSQLRHRTMGEAIGEALASQADAAAGASDPSAQDQGKQLSEAAGEVRAGTSQMSAAHELMEAGQNQAAKMSVDIEPILEAQTQAMEHLENAIRILEPPSPENQPKSEDATEDQPEPDGEKEEQVSRRQADRRLQAIRDREAERQEKQRERQRIPPEPVEKDW
jgi:hypothetical protein